MFHVFKKEHLEMAIKMHFSYSIAIGTEVQNEDDNFRGHLFLKYSLIPRSIGSIKRLLLSVLSSGLEQLKPPPVLKFLNKGGNVGKFKQCFSQSIGC